MLISGQRPIGMNVLSGRVFDVLGRFVVSPWSVLKVECGWRGVDPLHLDEAVLETLLPKMRAHVARMTDDDNANDVVMELQRLLRPPTPPNGVLMIEFDV